MAQPLPGIFRASHLWSSYEGLARMGTALIRYYDPIPHRRQDIGLGFLGPPQPCCCLPCTQPTVREDPRQGSLSWFPDRDGDMSFHRLGCLTAEFLDLLSLLTLPQTLPPALQWRDEMLHCLGFCLFSAHLQSRGSVWWTLCSSLFDRPYCRFRSRAWDTGTCF